MKNNVELRFVPSNADNYRELLKDPGSWELIVTNEHYGKVTVTLPYNIAMTIAVAIATARDAGIKEGYEKAKKKYKAINRAAGSILANKRLHPVHPRLYVGLVSAAQRLPGPYLLSPHCLLDIYLSTAVVHHEVRRNSGQLLDLPPILHDLLLDLQFLDSPVQLL